MASKGNSTWFYICRGFHLHECEISELLESYPVLTMKESSLVFPAIFRNR